MKPVTPVMDRIKNKVITNPGGCWEWQGATYDSGYGLVYDGNKNSAVHRTVYKETYGEIPDDMVVMHTCHNKSCCNPEHLKLGTKSQNTQDSMFYRNHNTSKKSYEWSGKTVQEKLDNIFSIAKKTVSGCIEWTRSTNAGYGVFSYRENGKPFSFLVHKFVYESIFRPLEDGELVRHICGNRLCCNPTHLIAGSLRDNSIDYLKEGKGRVLSDSDVTAIRYAIKNGELKKPLARKYSVSAQTIRNIAQNKTYKWLGVSYG